MRGWYIIIFVFFSVLRAVLNNSRTVKRLVQQMRRDKIIRTCHMSSYSALTLIHRFHRNIPAIGTLHSKRVSIPDFISNWWLTTTTSTIENWSSIIDCRLLGLAHLFIYCIMKSIYKLNKINKNCFQIIS